MHESNLIQGNACMLPDESYSGDDFHAQACESMIFRLLWSGLFDICCQCKLRVGGQRNSVIPDVMVLTELVNSCRMHLELFVELARFI